jgi:hypothetical protein
MAEYSYREDFWIFMELPLIHARYKGSTNETLCGKLGPSLEYWSDTAEEVTCPDCQAKTPTFTREELNAAIDPALRQLAREWGETRKD